MNSTSKPFIAGGLASCAAEITTFPIDLAKTRLQVTNNKYTGMFNCLKLTVKHEGYSALYKG
jgi:hypothetical protein